MKRRDLLTNAAIFAGAGSLAAHYPGRAGARMVQHHNDHPASHPFPKGVDYAAGFVYITRRDYADAKDIDSLIDSRLEALRKELREKLG